MSAAFLMALRDALADDHCVHSCHRLGCSLTVACYEEQLLAMTLTLTQHHPGISVGLVVPGQCLDIGAETYEGELLHHIRQHFFIILTV